MTGALEAQARIYDFVVMENVPIAKDIYALRICSDVASELKPGQFMNFAVPGDPSRILRIPLSFSRTDSSSQVWLEYAVVGEGTQRLSDMRAGDGSTLIGPCGSGWKLPADGGRCLVVAGGIGAPPILAAAHMLVEAGIGFDAVIGAKTAKTVLQGDLEKLRSLGSRSFIDCERTVILTCDDGTMGRAGLVTEPTAELLSSRPYASVYTCGSLPMMAAVAKLAKTAGVACQASLERMMGCGYGACSCCNVELIDGTQASCCMNGPVFDAEEVAW